MTIPSKPLVRRQTPKKKKLAQLITLNASSPSPISMQDLMREAGYSESTARTRHTEILGAARQEPEVQSHLARLKELQRKMLERMEVTLPKASYKEIVYGFEVLEKAITTLEGKASVQTDRTLTEEETKELSEILRMNE